MSEITGPFVDGAFFNKPSETVYFCVSCANERDIPEENAIMWDDAPDIQTMECEGCDSMVRSYE